MSPAPKEQVLFLCTGNSCRSQMAEGWLRALGGEQYEALSAGTRPVGLNPGAVAAMAAVGIDISGQRSKSIEEYLSTPPDLVVTVCDNAAESCPSFPGATRVEHWPFPDPADASGTPEQIAAEFAAVRDAIKQRIENWLAQRVG